MTELPPAVAETIESLGRADAPTGLGVAEAVAPQSVGDASRVMKAAAHDGVTVGFAGSGTNLELGGLGRFDLGMVSSGLSEIIEYEPEDLTVVVGSGVSIRDLDSELRARRQTTLLPSDVPDRTVGGLIAEGASSFSRLKYGPTRDRVLEVTIATGYGEQVRGGGRVVKNVTGYDLPRLVTGSMGSLGFIGSVCLKLWPLPAVGRVVRVDDAAMALASLYRPVSVLETDTDSFVGLEGSEDDVRAQTTAVGGEVDVAESPPPIDLPIVASIRIAPRSIAFGIGALRNAGATRWIAQHGVGVIEAGWPDLDAETFTELRKSVERDGGRVVVRRGAGSLDAVDPWGSPPGALAIQASMKKLFDPSAVCNPGKLPGGL
jgi:glycolate oxidase FAD binding subunit